MKRLLPILFLPLLVTTPLLAQDSDEGPCGIGEHVDETWAECFERLLDEGEAPKITAAKAMAESATKAEVDQEMQNDLVAAEAGGNASALRDLLPSFLTAIGVDGIDDSDGELKITHNFTPQRIVQVSLEGLVRQPTVFDTIVDEYPEIERSDRRSALEEDLGDFDDTDLSLALAIHDGMGAFRFGRAQRLYTDVTKNLFEDIFAHFEKASPTLDTPTREERRQALVAIQPLDRSQKVAETLNRKEFQEASAVLASSTLAFYRGVTTTLDEARYSKIGELIANQPQLVLTAKQRLRDDLVGPEGWSASLAWQGGTANVNGLLEKCPALAEQDPGQEAGALATCYLEYLNEKNETLKKGWRWSITAEYTKTDAWAFSRPDDGIDLSLDENQSWTAKAAIGRTLRLDDAGEEESRFDFEATYDDVTGDPEKQSRFLAAATVTQRLVDDMALSLSVVYADEPEYRGEVDEEFSARAGLRYKIDRKSDDG